MLIRKASLTDSETIYDLVNYYANKGLMLSRSRSSIYEYIRNYSVMEINGQVVGIGALSIFWSDLAEIRTLAVKKSFLRQGIGKKLVEHFIEEAKELGIKNIHPYISGRLFWKMRLPYHKQRRNAS